MVGSGIKCDDTLSILSGIVRIISVTTDHDV